MYVWLAHHMIVNINWCKNETYWQPTTVQRQRRCAKRHRRRMHMCIIFFFNGSGAWETWDVMVEAAEHAQDHFLVKCVRCPRIFKVPAIQSTSAPAMAMRCCTKPNEGGAALVDGKAAACTLLVATGLDGVRRLTRSVFRAVMCGNPLAPEARAPRIAMPRMHLSKTYTRAPRIATPRMYLSKTYTRAPCGGARVWVLLTSH